MEKGSQRELFIQRVDGTLVGSSGPSLYQPPAPFRFL